MNMIMPKTKKKLSKMPIFLSNWSFRARLSQYSFLDLSLALCLLSSPELYEISPELYETYTKLYKTYAKLYETHRRINILMINMY